MTGEELKQKLLAMTSDQLALPTFLAADLGEQIENVDVETVQNAGANGQYVVFGAYKK